MTNRRYFITKEATFSPINVKNPAIFEDNFSNNTCKQTTRSGKTARCHGSKNGPITKKLCE